MKVRYKGNNGKYIYGTSGELNTCGIGEAIVYFDDDSVDSMFMRDLEVQLKDKTWKKLNEAMDNKDIVINNLNTSFSFPHSEAERQQGFNWF